jgi:chromate transporter
MTQQGNAQGLLVPDSSGTFGLRDLAFYFLRLGTLGFGGPIALAGYMQRDLVEERHWFSTEDYLEGLAFSQLSPGPLMIGATHMFFR